MTAAQSESLGAGQPRAQASAPVVYKLREFRQVIGLSTP